MQSKGIAIAFLFVVIALVLSAGTWRTGAAAAAAHVAAADQEDHGDEIAILDDCDPTDPTWAPTGGCTLEKGDVNRAEFNALLFSPLSLSTVGHPAWRNEPSYLKIELNERVKVKNKGGRGHTFTEVAAFGGGRVPPLNRGLTPAPECAAAADLPPGASFEVTGLSVGNHRFQCCIHPWMRALIKVKPED
jgi:plastocyanin